MDQSEREASRLKTFKYWPYQFISCEKLAKTGFFYRFPDTDFETCFFCNITLGYWEETDDPETEHRRFARECPLLKNPQTTINVAIEDEENIPITESDEGYDVCGCGYDMTMTDSSIDVTGENENKTARIPDDDIMIELSECFKTQCVISCEST